MNKVRRYRKKSKEIKQKFNKAKSATLKLSLLMLNFIFATLAWFTYTMILDNSVDVNVSAWQVDFKDSSGTLGTSMQFQVANFYPGVEEEDNAKTLQIVNLGDRAASITYQIEKLNILGQTYTIKEEVVEGDSEYTLYKSETTDETAGTTTVKLLNNSEKFPFEITITHSTTIDIEDPNDETKNKGNFTIAFTWPYEITEIPAVLPDDLPENATNEEILEELNARKNILDTQWGYDIATFYKEQAEAKQEAEEQGETFVEEEGIEIILQAIAKQII